MRLRLLEMMRRQHDGEDRRVGRQLRLHQPGDHGLGDEFVPVDPAVDDEGRADDPVIEPGAGEPLGRQGDLERAGDVEDVGDRLAVGPARQLFKEAEPGLIDDPVVPTRLDEGEAQGFAGGFGALIHFQLRMRSVESGRRA